jgi:hypothetical protein
MPANPTWSLSSSGSGRRPTQFSARKRSGGTHWFLYFTIVFVAACIGGMSVYSWRALTRRKDPAFAFDESRSVAESADVPEFGQAAVEAELGQRDQNAAAQQAALRGVPVQEPVAAQVGLLGPKPVPRRKRKIVLSDGNGRWNTGVWPAWGYDPAQVTLNWAAAGVVVNKYCPMECEFTRDQDTSTADAVVMELVNHPKFGISESVPIPWPAKRDNPRSSGGGPRPTAIPEQLPLTVLFYFEAEQSYPKYTLMSDEVKRNIDISMTPDQSSTLPITLVCPWGKDIFDFLRNPKAKTEGRLLGYFNEHGVASSYRDIIDKLFDLAGDKLHSFIHRSNRPMPAEAGGDPYKLATRLDFMGTYKFMLVTEAIEGDDWIEPDLSHVFAAGAVPVCVLVPPAPLAPPPYVLLRALCAGIYWSSECSGIRSWTSVYSAYSRLSFSRGIVVVSAVLRRRQPGNQAEI